MDRVKTYKYNFYKINKERESDLRSFLISKGMEQVSTHEQAKYSVSLYLCAEPDLIHDIWWATQYQAMIPEVQRSVIQNSSFYGAVIISSDQTCFALPLGKSHFYLRDYADPDFGIELACRIADENSVPIVNTRSFGSKKTKSIATYTSDAVLDIEDGESLEYMRATIIGQGIWGKTGSFGVSVSLSSPVPPSEMHALVDKIEETLTQAPRFEPPRAIQVKSREVREQLDTELTTAIAGEIMLDGTVDIASVQLHGIEFVFRDAQSHILRGPHRTESEPLDVLDLETIRNFAAENNLSLVEQWQNIKIKHQDTAGNTKYTDKLRQIISYITTRDGKFYFLKDGKWFEFSESYITKLLQSVQDITVLQRDPSLDLQVNDYLTWKAANPTQTVAYQEYWYNTFVLAGENSGRIVYDRQLTSVGSYAIEALDAYEDATNTFIFVKRQKSTNDFAYLIDQAITSIKSLQVNNKVSVQGVNLQCKRAQLIIIQSRPVTNIVDIRSLLVLQKLNAFKSECRRKSIACEIRFQGEISAQPIQRVQELTNTSNAF